MDTFNREIISYVVSESQNLALAMNTVKQAMRGRKVKVIILHSDQGSIILRRNFKRMPNKTASSPACPGKEIAMIMPSWKASLAI